MAHKLPCSPTIPEVQTLAKFIQLGSATVWKKNAPHRVIGKGLAPRVLVSDRGVGPEKLGPNSRSLSHWSHTLKRDCDPSLSIQNQDMNVVCSTTLSYHLLPSPHAGSVKST